MIKSAAAIASSTSGKGLTLRGDRRTRRMGQVALSDARFSGDRFAVFEHGLERNELVGGRENAPADGQNFAADAHRAREIPGDMTESGEKQIAEAVSAEAAPGRKAILKQTTQQRLVLRKRHHAVADVAGRQDAVFPAQAARTAAVIGHCDDGSQVANGIARGIFRPRRDVFLQAAQQCGKARASADGHEPCRVSAMDGWIGQRELPASYPNRRGRDTATR